MSSACTQLDLPSSILFRQDHLHATCDIERKWQVLYQVDGSVCEVVCDVVCEVVYEVVCDIDKMYGTT